MNASEIYRQAAKLVEDGGALFPCLAVGSIASGNMTDWWYEDTLAGKFVLAMAPGKRASADSREASDRYLRATNSTLKEHSILALCFMAAIAEDEEQSRKRRR